MSDDVVARLRARAEYVDRHEFGTTPTLLREAATTLEAYQGEIARLDQRCVALAAENARLREIVAGYLRQHDAAAGNFAAMEDEPEEPCTCPRCRVARAALAAQKEGGK